MGISAIADIRKAEYFELVPVYMSVECIRHHNYPHFHNHTQIWYVISGTLKHNIFDAEYVQNPGSCAFILPYTPHNINLEDSEDTPVVISLTFPDSSLRSCGYDYFSYIRSLAHFDGRKIPLVTNLTGNKKEDADNLCREMISVSSDYSDDLREKLCHLLADFMRLFCTTPTGQEPPPPVWIEKADAIAKTIHYMSDHYNEKLNLDVLSAHAMMSHSVFTDVFKTVTGMTSKQFMTSLKLRHATTLMYFSDMSMNEIASEVGLYDNARLTHAFKQILKTSPSVIKQLNRENAIRLQEISKMRQKRFEYDKRLNMKQTDITKL